MALPADLRRELEGRVAALGFEVVECRVGGAQRRPLIQLRIDRPDAAPGHGITVDECAAVSRALEPWLDELSGGAATGGEAAAGVGSGGGGGGGGGRYVLEVSSPGLERPLRRADEWRRFLGQEAEVLVPSLNGRFRVRALRVVEDAPDGPAVELEFAKGVRRTLRLSEIKEARLAFEW